MMISPGTPRIHSRSGTIVASFPEALCGLVAHRHGGVVGQHMKVVSRNRRARITADAVTLEVASRAGTLPA